MRLLILFGAFLFFKSCLAGMACGRLEKQSVQYYDDLQQSTVTRSYFIYLPKAYCNAAYPEKRPVIFGVHGFYGTASGFALSTTEGALNRLAEEKHLIVVYPQGMSLALSDTQKGRYDKFYSSWNFLAPFYYNPHFQKDTAYYLNAAHNVCDVNQLQHVNPIPKQPGCHSWQGVCSWTSCYDDAGYLLAIQKQVQNSFDSDPKKQYLIGFSNGAMMVYRMACQYPEKFQGAVSIAGTSMRHMPCYNATDAQTVNPFLAKGETSLLIFIGSEDKVVPLTKTQDAAATANHYRYEYADDVLQTWQQQMHCQKKQTIDLPHFLENTQCTQYTRCGSENNSVAFCVWGNDPQKSIDRGHNYPGAHSGKGYCVSASQKALAKSYPICPSAVTPEAALAASRFMLRFLEQHSLA